MNKNLFLLLTALSFGAVICSEKTDAEKKIEIIKIKQAGELEKTKDKHVEALKKFDVTSATEVAQLDTKYIEDIKNKTTEEIENIKADHDKTVKTIQDKHSKERESLKNTQAQEIKHIEALNVQELTPRNWKKFFNGMAYNSVGLPLKALNYFDYLKDEKIGFKAVAAVTTIWAIVGGLVYFACNKYQEQRMKQKEDQSLDNLMKQILDDQEMKNTQQTEEA